MFLDAFLDDVAKALRDHQMKRSKGAPKKQEVLDRLRKEFDRRLLLLSDQDTRRQIDAVFATDGVRFKKRPKVGETQ